MSYIQLTASVVSSINESHFWKADEKKIVIYDHLFLQLVATTE